MNPNKEGLIKPSITAANNENCITGIDATPIFQERAENKVWS